MLDWTVLFIRNHLLSCISLTLIAGLLIGCYTAYPPRPIPEAAPQPENTVQSLAQAVTDTSVYSVCDLRPGTWAIDDELTLRTQPQSQLVISLVIHNKRLQKATLRFTRSLEFDYKRLVLTLSHITINDNGEISLEDLGFENPAAHLLFWPVLDTVKNRFLGKLQAETDASALLQGRFIVSRQSATTGSQNPESLRPDIPQNSIQSASVLSATQDSAASVPAFDFTAIISGCAMELSNTRLMAGSMLLLRNGRDNYAGLTISSGSEIQIRRLVMLQSDQLYHKILLHLNVDPFDHYDLVADADINISDGRFANTTLQVTLATGSSLTGTIHLKQDAEVSRLVPGSSPITLKVQNGSVSFGRSNVDLRTGTFVLTDVNVDPSRTELKCRFQTASSSGSMAFRSGQISFNNAQLAGQVWINSRGGGTAIEGAIDHFAAQLTDGFVRLATAKILFGSGSSIAGAGLGINTDRDQLTFAGPFSKLALDGIYGAADMGVNGSKGNVVFSSASKLRLTNARIDSQKITADLAIDMRCLAGQLSFGESLIQLAGAHVLASDLSFASDRPQPVLGRIDAITGPTRLSRIAWSKESALLLGNGNYQITKAFLQPSVGLAKADLSIDAELVGGHLGFPKGSNFDIKAGGNVKASLLRFNLASVTSVTGRIDVLNVSADEGRFFFGSGSYGSIARLSLNVAPLLLEPTGAISGKLGVDLLLKTGLYQLNEASQIGITTGHFASRSLMFSSTYAGFFAGDIDELTLNIADGSTIAVPHILICRTKGEGTFRATEPLKLTPSSNLMIGRSRLDFELEYMRPDVADSKIAFSGGKVVLPSEILYDGRFSSPARRGLDGQPILDSKGEVELLNDPISITDLSLLLSGEKDNLSAALNLTNGELHPELQPRLNFTVNGNISDLAMSYDVPANYGARDKDGNFPSWTYPWTLSAKLATPATVPEFSIAFTREGISGETSVALLLNMTIPVGVGEYKEDDDPGAGGKQEDDWANWQEVFRFRYAITLGTPRYVHLYLKPGVYQMNLTTKLDFAQKHLEAIPTAVGPVSEDELKEDTFWKRDGGPPDWLNVIVASALFSAVPLNPLPAELEGVIAAVAVKNWAEAYIDKRIAELIQRLRDKKFCVPKTDPNC